MKRKEKRYIILGIISGVILSATVSYVVAETVIKSKDVYYEDNSSLGVSNAQDAIDGTCIKFNNQLVNLKKEVIDQMYPVGSIYMSTSNTNPSTLFGGTWVTWGSGKVPVGVNTSDTDFNTVEKTGGAKEHRHVGTAIYAIINGLPYVGITNGKGAKTTLVSDFYGVKIEVSNVPGANLDNAVDYYTSYEKNLSPYITCYMWKRTK